MSRSPFLTTIFVVGWLLLITGVTGAQAPWPNPLHIYWSGEPIWWRVGAGVAMLAVSVYGRRFARVA